MLKQFRNRYLFVSDVLLLLLGSYASFVLRLDRFDLGSFWPGFAIFTGIALLAIPLFFRYGGVYARYWPYASIEEVFLLGGMVTAAVLTIAGCVLLFSALLGSGLLIPRAVPLIFALLAAAATAGPRLLVRRGRRPSQQRRHSDRPQRVLIVGAGEAGRMIVRELQHNPQLGLEVAGLVDDDAAKQGMRIHGATVLGRCCDIPALVGTRDIGQVIIAMPTAPGQVIRTIRALCEQAGVPVKVMPGIYELLDGTVTLSQLRDVQIEDLLRREPVRTDIAAVRELLRGRRVLVTGGGGSIGSELCRQILRCEPAELIILGHGENSIFAIEHELRRTLAAQGLAAERQPRLTTVIADIRCAERIHRLFAQHRPQIVFHAAAHKHVPLMELNPAEAITNNVLGTRNLLAAAQAVGVERFVMISTDKAVNPTSIMGASKRAAELLVHQAAHASGRAYVAVRFGNVLGSRGSVVLTFREQIAAGGPVTITDPRMQRYFMTIPEAVQLVLQAAVLGRGGEVFVLDMGQPVKIIDLARDMIQLSGLQVGRDIEIVTTGLRPGEKLFEELFVPGEIYGRTRHAKIFIAENASAFVPQHLTERIEELAQAATRDDHAAIVQGLQRLIPEFQPPVAAGQEQAAAAGPRALPLRQPEPFALGT